MVESMSWREVGLDVKEKEQQIKWIMLWVKAERYDYQDDELILKVWERLQKFWKRCRLNEVLYFIAASVGDDDYWFVRIDGEVYSLVFMWKFVEGAVYGWAFLLDHYQGNVEVLCWEHEP